MARRGRLNNALKLTLDDGSGTPKDLPLDAWITVGLATSIHIEDDTRIVLEFVGSTRATYTYLMADATAAAAGLETLIQIAR